VTKLVDTILGCEHNDHRVLVYLFNEVTKCVLATCTPDNAANFDPNSDALGDFLTPKDVRSLHSEVLGLETWHHALAKEATDHPQVFISAEAAFTQEGRTGIPKHLILITGGRTDKGFGCEKTDMTTRFQELAVCGASGNPCKTENTKNDGDIFVNGVCAKPSGGNKTGCSCQCQCGLVKANDIKKIATLTVVGVVNDKHIDNESEFDDVMSAMASGPDHYIKAKAIDASALEASLKRKLKDLHAEVCK